MWWTKKKDFYEQEPPSRVPLENHYANLEYLEEPDFRDELNEWCRGQGITMLSAPICNYSKFPWGVDFFRDEDGAHVDCYFQHGDDIDVCKSRAVAGMRYFDLKWYGLVKKWMDLTPGHVLASLDAADHRGRHWARCYVHSCGCGVEFRKVYCKPVVHWECNGSMDWEKLDLCVAFYESLVYSSRMNEVDLFGDKNVVTDFWTMARGGR